MLRGLHFSLSLYIYIISIYQSIYLSIYLSLGLFRHNRSLSLSLYISHHIFSSFVRCLWVSCFFLAAKQRLKVFKDCGSVFFVLSVDLRYIHAISEKKSVGRQERAVLRDLSHPTLQTPKALIFWGIFDQIAKFCAFCPDEDVTPRKMRNTDKLSTDYRQTTDRLPTTTDELPMTTDELPTNYRRLPTTTDRLPTTTDRLPTNHRRNLHTKNRKNWVLGGSGMNFLDILLSCACRQGKMHTCRVRTQSPQTRQLGGLLWAEAKLKQENALRFGMRGSEGASHAVLCTH